MSALPTPQPHSSRAEAIREIFAAHRFMTVRDLTIACIDHGLFDSSRFKAMVRAFMPEVERALKEPRVGDRLPFAMPTADLNSENRREWAQPELLSREDFDFNITSRVDGITSDVQKLQPIVDYRIGRWGDIGLPVIPKWVA